MKIGRNDPCPCGSGKKYKHCCQEKDLAEEEELALGELASEAFQALLASGIEEVSWQVALVPLGIQVEDDRNARPAVLLVAMGPVPLHVDLVSDPPAEPAEVAALLAQGIRSAADQAGGLPSRIEVRDPEIARLLTEALAAPEVALAASPSLDALDQLAQGLMQAVAGGPPPGFTSPDTWAAWELPREQVAALFRAAAAFYRAAPWRFLNNLQLLHATLPGGSSWTACVLGNGGEEFGLALYAEIEDFIRQVEAEHPAEAFVGLQAPVLSLTFDRRGDLPRPMQREVAAAGWEVAGTDAYPVLVALNSPEGVGEAEAQELTGLLRAIPRFVERHQAILAGEEAADLPLDWRDPESGIELRYAGHLVPTSGLWELPQELAPALPEGPRARPEAALETPDDPEELREAGLEIVERFASHLRKEGLKDETVDRHASNSEIFVDFLASYQGIRLAAVTEWDLRIFLYDWYPRKVVDSRTRARSVPTSLRRFFSYLAAEEEIRFPWAEAILRAKDSFEARLEEFPGGFWWDEEVQEWQQELYTDLDARVMLHDPALAAGETWGPTMGIEEATLDRELGRRWLLWRDEVIRSGVRDPQAVRAVLIRRQREWEKAPHPELKGRTPLQTIKEERRKEKRRKR